MKSFLFMLSNPYFVLVWFLTLIIAIDVFNWTWVGSLVYSVIYFALAWALAQDMSK